jgi:hypothetical protein
LAGALISGSGPVDVAEPAHRLPRRGHSPMSDIFPDLTETSIRVVILTHVAGPAAVPPALAYPRCAQLAI